MVGSALIRCLQAKGYKNITTASRKELDLLDSKTVASYFSKNKFTQIYLAAAKVGGIHANNTYPADFIYENLMIEANVIHAAHSTDVKKLLFLGSSCIYPKDTDQPMSEDALLSGKLEPTNEPYAIAKIAGIKLCESYNRQYGRDYRSVMPTNLYGPGDNFHKENSHVVPALIRRFHEAVEDRVSDVVIWGSGKPMREFLYVDDMAAACCHVMQLSSEQYASSVEPRVSHINIGTGVDCTIRTLAETISRVTGFNGRLIFDDTKPDGTYRKLLDVSRMTRLGWQAKVALEQGIADTYSWYIENRVHARS